MPVSSINSYQFIALQGTPVHPGLVLQNIARPGKNGMAYRKDGIRGDPFPMIGKRDFETYADAKLFIANIARLEGSSVALNDDLGNSYTAILLKSRPVSLFKTVGATGGLTTTPGYFLTIELIFQIPATTA
jgi:hypothetical protein